MSTVQIVWFKKSFRLTDHPCLASAAERGPVLPLYIVEPAYWQLPDTSYRHYLFLKGCIEETAKSLQALGGGMLIRTGSAVDVLAALNETFPNFELWSYQETGNAWTYERDKAVRQWCRSNGIPFHEPLQFGVWRGSKIDRDHWAKHWDAFMSEPVAELPAKISFAEHADLEGLDVTVVPASADLGLTHDGIQTLQTPGRQAGLAVLNSFLHERGESYRTDMSSPVTGESGCSRLSPHLTYGTLSMREIYQTAQKRLEVVRSLPKEERGTWAGALSSFIGRLHWHCHFTQKLELEPELEWLPMARAYVGLRDQPLEEDAQAQASGRQQRLEAFEKGQTGYPFVDACLRYLRATGWINFRMRAMLMSFASYDLWLPWQESGTVLAGLFTDYEPGIHWPQTQMQSGVTGINAIRVYSPIKQGLDQDPDGAFTRRWVPEIAHLPDEVLQTPWRYEKKLLDYPAPLVEHRSAVAAAKSKVWAIKKSPDAKQEAEAVYKKHGSRKRPRDTSNKRRKTKKKTAKVTAKADQK
ncbi:MAG: FAD-binding domain-containing protein [Cyanobacteria bacterium J06626_6]